MVVAESAVAVIERWCLKESIKRVAESRVWLSRPPKCLHQALPSLDSVIITWVSCYLLDAKPLRGGSWHCRGFWPWGRKRCPIRVLRIIT